ncbi:MAG: peptidoglycan-binding protein, partial [Clostridiales bacterium]|nr:peptidoglycan-binding protein [Clostridiales bacterium]
MNIGYLTVILRMASGALPAANMKVQIKGASGNVLYDLTTGADGSTEQVALETAEETFGLGRHPIGFYDVEIPPSGGLSALSIKGVEVYEGVASVLPVTVTSFTGEDMSKNIFLPKEHGADWRSAVETQAIPGPDDYPAGTHATAPLTIVVHMGYYRDPAENVQVPFLDYLKNIASNEAYADWDRGSLYATVYCLSTFALNRVFTEWYRNQGYPFDITSDPRSDPIYQEGRPIPSNIFQIAELLLNVFISRKDSIAPIFPIYGGGPLPCAGFSMQEALQMSSKGYSPLDILKHFFGKGLNLQEADLPSSMLENPGHSGEGIKRIQSCLNDLRISYPSIPEIKPENGKFSDDTKEAIAEFQRIFRLTVSGVLTPATQSQLGVVGESLRSLKRLLKERSSLKLEEPPDDKLSYGMDPAAQSGSVLILHHILNFLSLFNPAIPGVSEDIFGYETEESVAAFQRAFKISEAGAVGEATWPKLFEEYSSLQDSILDLGEEPDIPAFPDLQAK